MRVAARAVFTTSAHRGDRRAVPRPPPRIEPARRRARRAAHRPAQVGAVHGRPGRCRSVRRSAGVRRGAGTRASTATATRSARRSSSATTCSACSANRAGPARAAPTTCARASGRCSCCARSSWPTTAGGQRPGALPRRPRASTRSTRQRCRDVVAASGALASVEARDRRAPCAGRSSGGATFAGPPARCARRTGRACSAADRLTMSRVVVIGAGLGGLSAACHLAGAGHDVTVVERGDRPGGRAGTLELGGYRFDTGPTVLTMPELFERCFAAVGVDMSSCLTAATARPDVPGLLRRRQRAAGAPRTSGDGRRDRRRVRADARPPPSTGSATG